MSAVPGGPWTILIVVVVIAALVALALWRRGAPGRARGASRSPRCSRTTTAAPTTCEQRLTGPPPQATGGWPSRSASGAVIRGLEERTILDRRPGRTADEAAAAAASALPPLATELTFAAELFDAVTYGRRDGRRSRS